MGHSTTAAVGLFLLALTHSTMSITVQDFFSTTDIKSNLTKVTWSHAVNTKEMLDDVLKRNNTMMIEADVSMGKVKGDSGEKTYPVMAHEANAPLIDIKLDEFLDKVVKKNKTGIKLDFKSIDALKEGVNIINSYKNITVPLWINADIIRGPNATDAQKEVEASKFFENTNRLTMKDAVLSVGWTTSVTKNGTAGKYEMTHINSMAKALNESKINCTVTYPVRAIFVANDDKDNSTISKLLEMTKDKNATLTIWSANDDNVDSANLSAVINRIGLAKVYLDVPAPLRQKLDLNAAFNARSSASLLLSCILVAFGAFKVL